jgi:Kef-type K+ transport system membrane component KefB/nucleotide-binding universal stress UspA family protein
MHSALPLFIVQAILIILASRLLGVVARRMGQPLVIAEVVAGIALGPSLLGWLLPHVEEAVFPKTSMPTLGLLSQVGLVLFMFLIGLELDPKLLKGRTHTSVAISHTSIIVPFALGAGLAFHIHQRYSPTVPFSSFMLFMGVAMSITAFPVLARILVERRLLRTKIGSITIACAAVDDVTAWCILAFVVSVARATGTASAIRTTVFALGYIAIMFAVVRPLFARFADRTRSGLTQNRVAVTLVLLLGSAWITELIGIHALFGAFLFGAILPKEGGFAAALAEKIEDLVVVLFLPLFFAYSGLRTHIGLVNSADNLVTCALITFLACVGKFGGSALAARFTGMSWRESSAIGVLMNTRGLVELIVLNIGLDLGVLSPTLFTMLVIMALVTTFMTTPLLERIYPAEQLAREILLASEEAAAASVPTVESERYAALVCVSYETTGPGLITLGAALVGKNAQRARLYALRLLRPNNRASFVLDQQAGTQPGATPPSDQDPALGPCVQRAGDLGVPLRPLSFVSDDPGKDICGVAEVKAADIVLLGWHKPVLGSTMLSGTAHEVMTSAKQDVGVFINRGLEKVERILVPYLGSDNDRAALRLAKRIAENTGAKVTVLHVVIPDKDTERLGAAAHVNDEFHETAGTTNYTVEFRAITHSAPAEAVIEETASGKHDLMIIGLGRPWGLEHRPFGLQAEAILDRSAISVLAVRQARVAQDERATAPAEAARARFESIPVARP